MTTDPTPTDPTDRRTAPPSVDGQTGSLSPAGQAAPPTVLAQVSQPRGPRLRTIVWGLILLGLGLGVVGAALGYRFDARLSLIALLAVAGTVLLIGSLARVVRDTR